MYKLNYETIKGCLAIVYDIAEEALENIVKFHESKAMGISNAIERNQMYELQRWDILREFCDPENANYQEACEELYDLIWDAIEEVQK